MNDLQDIVKDFLVESHENLDQLDRNLIRLEQDPASEPILGSIFRTVHTIKGSCGFLGFGKLEGVAHVGENLLSMLRDGTLRLKPEITTGLLRLVDAIREILENIETLGAEGDADYSELIFSLADLQRDSAIDATTAAAITREAETVAVAVPPATTIAARADHESCLAGRESQKTNYLARHGSAQDSTIRVEVELLDKLMHLVGQLALARNQILRITGATGDSTLFSAGQRLNSITTELEEGVMKTRMQPIGNLWNKFPRVVRDLAMYCGKEACFEMEGREIELEKSVAESIKDPLTHLVRNAIDHGIEPTDERVRAGKPAAGRVLLRAFQERGQVHIEVSDDGRGLNLERIRQKAIERGILTVEQALRMSEREAALLIFAPGFSTAPSVTHISGRGVGLDVVKTNVERIGGTVEIHSRLGHGTTIHLRIPLTLAITPAPLMMCGGDHEASLPLSR